MVNASINWASLCGIILALYGIPAGILGFVQLVFILQKRADISSSLILKSIGLDFLKIHFSQRFFLIEETSSFFVGH